MHKKRIDIIRKHQKAIEDLVQVGILDARILAMDDVYRARRVMGMKEEAVAKVFKCSKRTVSRYVTFLETDI